MRRFIKCNYVFLHRVKDEKSFFRKLFLFSLYLEYLLPYRILLENSFRRKYEKTYMFTFIFAFYTLPLFSPYLILVNFYILNILFIGCCGYIYLKIYPKSVETLDAFLYKSYFREYFLGNPTSSAGKLAAGVVGAWAFKVTGSGVENVTAMKYAVHSYKDMKEAGTPMPATSEEHIRLIRDLAADYKKSMPLEWTSNLIVDSINRVTGSIEVSDGQLHKPDITFDFGKEKK
jgi:hypothetical protein